MKDSTNTVSVITASYNMAQFLGPAIESVLAQTYSNLEHIVIDDGSTDDTESVVRKLAEKDDRIRYFYQPNAGQTVAKNHGLKEAQGDYIAFVDADNMWVPDKLERQMKFFESCPSNVGVHYSDVQLINGKGELVHTPYEKKHSGKITRPLLMNNFVKFNTVLIPRRVLDDVGFFDEELSMGIDYELWLRISVDYDFHHTPENLVLYRIWEGQMSHRTLKRIENGKLILKKFFEAHGSMLSERDIRRAWAQLYTGRARFFIQNREKDKAIQDLRTAFGYDPLFLYAWKSLGRFLITR